MDLAYIHTFLRVAEIGNVSKAAEELHYSQSTVTGQIQALEKELGITLFERVGRKNQLTTAGQSFLHYASEIENTIRKAKAIDHSPENDRSLLCVGTVESLMTGYLTPVMPAFRHLFPNASLDLFIGSQAQVIEQLGNGVFDAIFVYTKGGVPQREAFRMIGSKQIDTVFLAGRDHPLAGRQSIPYREILRYPIISTEKSSDCYQSFLDDSAAIGEDFRFSVRLNVNGPILALLQDQCSITQLPYCSARQAIASGEVVALDVTLARAPLSAQFVVRKNAWISPPLSRLIELVLDYDL